MNSSLSCLALDTDGLLRRRVMLAMIKATGRLREKSTVLTFSSVAVPIRINNPDYTSINQQVGGFSGPAQVLQVPLGLIWLRAAVTNVDDCWRERRPDKRRPTTLFPNDDIRYCPLLFLSP